MTACSLPSLKSPHQCHIDSFSIAFFCRLFPCWFCSVNPSSKIAVKDITTVYTSTQQLGPPCGTITSRLRVECDSISVPRFGHLLPTTRPEGLARQHPNRPRPQDPIRDTPTFGSSAPAPRFDPLGQRPARDSPASVQPL